MDINSIITIVIYVLFFLSLIVGALWGLGRGLKKSSLRLGTLVVFLIIAGLITPLISKALLTINLSSFNINVNGIVVTTIPELIRNSLFSITGFQEIAESMPSVMTLVEGLPVAIMNVVVFILLIFIMQFISWIVFIILSNTTLKETKLEKQIKKQKKLEKKNKVVAQNDTKQLNPEQKPKALPLAPPKKRRLLGCLIGAVQGFILIFLALMPVTSICGSIGEVTAGTSTIDTGSSLVIYAEETEENEFLSEYSSDLIKNALGEEVISYFNTFNNSVPTKILGLGGFNNVLFDSLSTVTVNGQNIAMRKDVLTATKIYDKFVEIMDQVDTDDWSTIDFDTVRDAVNLIFDTGLFKAFAEDAVPYALDKVYSSGDFTTMEYSTEIREALNLIVSSYEEDPDGFINSLKNDVNSLIDIAESVFESGLIDEVISNGGDYNAIITIIKADNYKLLSEFTNNAFDSYIFKIVLSKGLNIALDIGSTELTTEELAINLGTTDYSQINWASMDTSLYNIIKKALDIYDIINLYGFDAFMENPQTVLADVSSEDLATIMSIFGQEIDLIKDSPLFAGQTNTPVKGLIVWGASQVEDYVDADAMLAITSWQTELESLSGSLVGLKDSGILDLLVDSSTTLNIDTVIAMLLDPVSEEQNADTYLSDILTPIVNSTITKKLIVYGLNKANSTLSESLPELTLSTFSVEDLTADQNDDIITIVENVAKCFTIFSSEINFETITTADITKLADLLTALKNNAFRIGAGTGIEKMNSDVDLTNKNVTGGGIFSNYYISLISYLLGDSVSINYKTVDWLAFLTSAKNLGSSLNELGGESGGISDIIDFGNPESAEDLKNLLDSIGLDGGIVEDLTTIADTMAGLSDGTIDEATAFGKISTALTAIIKSQDEKGNNTVDTIIDMIETATGDDTISDQISSKVLASELTVSNRLHLLLTPLNSQVYPIDYNDSTADSIHSAMNQFNATIADLTCGATYVLQQAVTSGRKISFTNITAGELTNAINTATTDETVRTLVASLFKVEDGI